MAFEAYQQFPGALPAGGTTLTVATELAYQTSTAGVEIPDATPNGIVIRGYALVTAGASTTGFTIKCRRGSGIAGTQVGNSQVITAVASSTDTLFYSFNDAAPPAGQTVYTVTVTAIGANGTAVDGAMSVTVPEPFGTAT